MVALEKTVTGSTIGSSQYDLSSVDHEYLHKM